MSESISSTGSSNSLIEESSPPLSLFIQPDLTDSQAEDVILFLFPPQYFTCFLLNLKLSYFGNLSTRARRLLSCRWAKVRPMPTRIGEPR